MNGRPIKILIVDWIPPLNKGEMAILEGILKTFELLGKVEVSILSFNPQLDKDRYPKNIQMIDVGKELHLGGLWQKRSGRIRECMPTAILAAIQHLLFGFLYSVLKRKAFMVARGRIWKEYCETDAILICHDQVSCLFGPSPLLFLPLYVTLLAKALRKPIAIYGNSTNKFKKKIWEKLATYVLDNVDLVTVREEETFSYFKKLARRKSHIFLTADPAFLLAAADVRIIKRIIEKENIKRNDGLLIGFTLTHENFLGAFTGRVNYAEKKEFIEKAADLVDRLVEEFHATVIFLPHCIEPHRLRDDRNLAEEIHRKARAKNKIVVLLNEYSAGELKGLIGFFDLFVGGRVHSVVSAVSMGVPSIAVTRPEDIRIRGIIGGTMKQTEWIYEIKAPNLDGLLSKIENLMSTRHKVSNNLTSQAKIAKEKAFLNGKLLRKLLISRR